MRAHGAESRGGQRPRAEVLEQRADATSSLVPEFTAAQSDGELAAALAKVHSGRPDSVCTGLVALHELLVVDPARYARELDPHLGERASELLQCLATAPRFRPLQDAAVIGLLFPEHMAECIDPADGTSPYQVVSWPNLLATMQQGIERASKDNLDALMVQRIWHPDRADQVPPQFADPSWWVEGLAERLDEEYLGILAAGMLSQLRVLFPGHSELEPLYAKARQMTADSLKALNPATNSQRHALVAAANLTLLRAPHVELDRQGRLVIERGPSGEVGLELPQRNNS